MVILAPRSDVHADAVGRRLDLLNTSWCRLSAEDLPTVRVRWRPEPELRIESNDGDFVVTTLSTIWWRRLGWPTTDHLKGAEKDLCWDEVNAALPGALLSLEARIVDPPQIQSLAGYKLRQLALAHGLGIPIPRSAMTNSPTAAASFDASVDGDIVAKALSDGFGIAPFVQRVPVDQLSRVSECPVLLQEQLLADWDVRVVTVADRAFTWHRPRRSEQPVDWRAADPSGDAFRRCQNADLEQDAVRLAAAMDLSFTVQDWLIVDHAPVFLEVNPQGQWLFLKDAEAVVAEALAEYLSRSAR